MKSREGAKVLAGGGRQTHILYIKAELPTGKPKSL